MKKGIIAGVCALALGALLGTSFAQAQEKTLRVAHYGFNPQKGRFEMAFGSQSTLPLMAFADSLTFLNPDGSVDPGLATSWSVKNDTTWVFNIRQGVKFQNGAPMTADQIVKNVNFLIDDDMGKISISSRFLGLAGAKKIDETTVEISTKAPNPILDRWFESDVLKSTLATDAIIGTFQPISAPGTGYVLLHHVMGSAGGARGVWGGLVGSIRNVKVLSALERMSVGVGALISFLLVLAHHRLYWWPLHPIGFGVAMTVSVNSGFLSLLLVWFVKVILLKLGGVKFYQRGQPFVIGMLAAYALGVLLSYGVDLIWFPGNGHPIHGW